ncbi:MAG: nucleotide exchange factor GrpE [Candidatus Moraniibacteriota bacterium]|nr:MAG: nucleotide exchange factor GrpE [Candidatus Moranbacteria bacterium]
MTEDKSTAKQLFRLSQKALFYNPQDKTFLILKAAKTKTGHPEHAQWMKEFGPWDLPGGHVDDGEYKNVAKAFAREIVEEVGITLQDEYMLCHTEVMMHKKAIHPGLNHFYLVQYNGEDITLSEEHEDFRWMRAEDIYADKEIKLWIKNTVEKAEQMIALTESEGSWKRCVADFDNYKKRQAQQQKEFTAYAAEGVIAEMLPVLDNFHAATEHVPETEAESPWVTGIMFIQQQMEKVFEERGVTKIDVSVGDEFDPHIMEAMKNDEEQELDENAKVAKIAQHGYKIGEKIVRPARVLLG